jgi:hypothetical protein
VSSPVKKNQCGSGGDTAKRTLVLANMGNQEKEKMMVLLGDGEEKLAAGQKGTERVVDRRPCRPCMLTRRRCRRRVINDGENTRGNKKGTGGVGVLLPSPPRNTPEVVGCR